MTLLDLSRKDTVYLMKLNIVLLGKAILVICSNGKINET